MKGSPVEFGTSSMCSIPSAAWRRIGKNLRGSHVRLYRFGNDVDLIRHCLTIHERMKRAETVRPPSSGFPSPYSVSANSISI